MDHIGIDLGGRESQICVRSPEGAIRWEGRWETPRIAEYVRELPHSRIVLETCAEAFAVADAIAAAGHEVRVVPCSLVRSLGVGARGVKTDEKDARALSGVMSGRSAIRAPPIGHGSAMEASLRNARGFGRLEDQAGQQ
jgi:transposase